MIVDFHSHMLPGIDDGAKNLKTSVKMLYAAAEQGVDVQVLTPHFYPWRENTDSFIDRRDECVRRLLSYRRDWWPKLLVGAEVAFFGGMARAELSELCIGESNVLLVELPFESWSRQLVDEIAELTLDRNYRVILAHIERYITYKGNREMLLELAELPLAVQMNAEAFLAVSSRFRSVPLAKEFRSFLLGSDAHGIEHRPPNLLAGREAVEKHLGRYAVYKTDKTGAGLIQGIEYL